MESVQSPGKQEPGLSVVSRLKPKKLSKKNAAHQLIIFSADKTSSKKIMKYQQKNLSMCVVLRLLNKNTQKHRSQQTSQIKPPLVEVFFPKKHQLAAALSHGRWLLASVDLGRRDDLAQRNVAGRAQRVAREVGAVTWLVWCFLFFVL